ncbi:P-loop containing nucleoside triphosphate hydrolases superfamily protein [Rhynchospora pubera]|uniref:P-loop containing nucleoside triphosphate hydrolases superfamily protein n=1 Tax=Rhynchospora pubera TaxID=906938 RepID=A0AAV8HD64_9POAL|nr:P-loop containing nucleoside triphosphate hydrolases superfamily protein [Rhynchospora pubera]
MLIRKGAGKRLISVSTLVSIHILKASTLGSLVMKPQKKLPIVLKIFVPFFLLISGVLMFLVCFEQIRIDKKLRLLSISSAPRSPCQGYQFSKSETGFVHYPQPSNYKREECACTPVRYFAIISMQRSGSGWFEALLNSHENISSNGEIFQIFERRSNISAIKRILDRVYNLDFYTSAAKNECTAAVGLKWMLNQGLVDNYDDIVEYFVRRGISAIFIFRRNLLRRIVSQIANDFDRNFKQLNGTHKSHVHTIQEAEVLARFKPTINATNLVSKLDWTNEYIAAALQKMKRVPHLVVYYEDVIKNSSVLLDVQHFLGVPQKVLFSKQIKIHRKPLRDQIENWDEVYHALNGTRYENFLYDD